MPVRYFNCKECDITQRTLKKELICEDCGVEMKRMLKAPDVKMLETIDAEKGKYRIKDQMKTLKARSREYTRNNDLDELVQTNSDEQALQNQWIVETSGGGVRKRLKIDDI